MKPELLSPAGSMDSMRAAIGAGADAVYMGGTRFGARAYADNPDEQGLLEALDFCHFYGKSLYLTVNTLFKEQEIEELGDYLQPLYEAGLDAVIVQDYGAAAAIREYFPGLPIHASTQMAVAGKHGVALLRELGISRLVLPRELSLRELRDVTEQGGIETECFIHGALCYCYSGQCLMSSLIGGRSGNRGRCAQVCRLPFPDDHLLNLKDLNTLDILPDIIDTGVRSLKIEGRMKSPRYTAGVTGIYRKYIDLYCEKGREAYSVSEADRQILRELFDRGGVTTGYYTRHNGKDMIYKGEKPERIPDETVLSAVEQVYSGKYSRVPVQGTVRLEVGRPAMMTLTDGKYTVQAVGEQVQRARNSPLSEDDVRNSIMKFGDSHMEPEKMDIVIKGDVFLPVSAVNRLRREAVDRLTKERINAYKRANI